AEAPNENAASADGAAPGKKKRRRRRRKKKAGPGDGTEDTPDGEAKAKKKGVRPEKPPFNAGDDVFGRVVMVNEHAIVIEVAGGKALGLYDANQLNQVPPREGEQFIAKVKSYSTRGGMLILGTELFDTTQTKLELQAALEASNPIEVWVTGVIKGGLEVDYKGIRGFAPASQMELRPSSDLSHFLGQKHMVFVTHYGKRGKDVVFSRKKMLEDEHKALRAEFLDKIKPEMVCKGVVRNVATWGAFIALPDFGDIEGVVHMSEASHDRGARLNQIFKPGREIEVQVLKVDESGKLWLSRKALVDDPWASVSEKYPQRSIHTAKVVRLTEFGAFIQLEPGVDGLCHVSDLSFSPIEHPKDVVEVGQDIEVIVASVDAGKHKVSLHPAPPQDERELPSVQLKPHQVVNAIVTQIRDSGLNVRILGMTGRAARAYLPANQTGTPRGADLRKNFPIGKRFVAKITEVDRRRGEARLSIRAMKTDAERDAYRDYKKEVKSKGGFGTFADLLNKKL
ncbi:MAG: S1 RNA-binding domain-containing protein, partial [Polyangiaceae bacterium]